MLQNTALLYLKNNGFVCLNCCCLITNILSMINYKYVSILQKLHMHVTHVFWLTIYWFLLFLFIIIYQWNHIFVGRIKQYKNTQYYWGTFWCL